MAVFGREETHGEGVIRGEPGAMETNTDSTLCRYISDNFYRTSNKGRTFRKALCSFMLSDSFAGASFSSPDHADSSSSVSLSVASRHGRISYSPVSQISRLPVDVDAVSIRWFFIRLA